MQLLKRGHSVLGTIGTVFWAFQLVPQIIKSHRRKDTDGLSAWLLLIWVAGSIPQGTYLVVQNINIPLIVQPQLFSTFAIIAMAQCWHYSHGIALRKCIAAGVVTGAVAGGLETAFYFLCKLGQDRGTSAATKTMGIVGAVLIVLGLVPQYYEIWRWREVKGISLWFLAIDCAGGVFSLLSLVFKAEFDGIAAANYIGIVVLELGIFALYFTLNPRAKRRRQELPSEATTESTAPQQQGAEETPDWSRHTTLEKPPQEHTT
ncbi:predicted membrane protein [Moesziomyces antarcticus T-34]|uniref:Predicted membrane protein n=1 Tax=Pseudozyma antarctica (strain T-34) TaxID=1151754 RepID=M9M7U2_PSEA3|nr:predicted membrane protein [Moesziomyces antarcticus T-34]